VLEQVLQQIVKADPKYGPVHLIKVDVANRFYRVWLNLQDIPKLVIAIPEMDCKWALLALPLVLPMGWTKSPPYFSFWPKMVTFLQIGMLDRQTRTTPHRLDKVAGSCPAQEEITASLRSEQGTAVPTEPLQRR
jgi:hypothetical protein